MPPKKGSKRKTPKKGGFYSFSGDLGAPGAANWVRGSEMGPWAVTNRGGNTQYGRGRKQKGKKGNKKTRRTKRGGGSYGGVSASYLGSGERGLANFAGISPNKPGFATQGDFNYYGGKPGDGLPNFISAGSK